MELAQHLERVIRQLREGHYRNEASISQGVVLPALNYLGWNVFDTSSVSPEFPIGNRRVDFALCDDRGTPLLLIEVKQPGKAEGADQQLFEYAFHGGVQFVILTDGREWHFYLPGEQGSYHERRVYKLDLIERTIDEAVDRLSRYLKKGRVCSGQSLSAAREDYKDVVRDTQIEQTLPLATSGARQSRYKVLGDRDCSCNRKWLQRSRYLRRAKKTW